MTLCTRALAVASGLLAVAGMFSPAASAQALYSMNDGGRVSVNGTLLETLPGSKWVELVVIGSDRWALRDTGRIFKNGELLYKLICKDGNDNVDEGDWVGLAVVNGEVWALSAKGYLARDGECVALLTQGEFVFTTLESGGGNVWSLRSDGTAFVNLTAQPVFAFQAGPGLEDAEEGTAEDTTWRSATVGPDDKLYALRRDGKLLRGDVVKGETSNGVIIAALPFGENASPALLYDDVFFTEDGLWNVMRGRGDMFNENNLLTPFIEFNGTPDDNSGQRFKECLPLPVLTRGTTAMSFFALRRDGRLFRETDEASFFDLSKSGYGQLAISVMGPDLTHVKNAVPKVTTYKVNAVSGVPFTFPILATDPDKTSADLVVTVDPETLPVGAMYDAVTRTITWADPVKGAAKIKVTVDDGVGKIVKKTYKIKVRDPDDNPDKNRKPRIGAIKGTQGLVGFELSIPILVSDEDGDVLTVTVDESVPPFTQGAMFDAVTNTFVWPDPQLSDIDKYTLKFTVTDGTAKASIKLKIQIIASFLTF